MYISSTHNGRGNSDKYTIQKNFSFIFDKYSISNNQNKYIVKYSKSAKSFSFNFIVSVAFLIILLYIFGNSQFNKINIFFFIFFIILASIFLYFFLKRFTVSNNKYIFYEYGNNKECLFEIMPSGLFNAFYKITDYTGLELAKIIDNSIISTKGSFRVALEQINDSSVHQQLEIQPLSMMNNEFQIYDEASKFIIGIIKRSPISGILSESWEIEIETNIANSIDRRIFLALILVLVLQCELYNAASS